MQIDEKAQEISFILVKVSVYVRRRELREGLERLSFALLAFVASRDFSRALKTVASLEAMIRFGKLIYEIEPINADLLLKRLDGLNAAIRQIAEGSLPDRDVEIIVKESVKKQETDKEHAVNPKKIDKKEEHNQAMESGNGVENQAMRQSDIFEKIKSFAEKPVQLKDIASLFPDVSNRTLRYDLQRLCADGKIERIGQGGPATYYKARIV